MPNPGSSYSFLDPPESSGELGRLAGYRVISLLGEGGMGQVFKALDTKLEREVALKLMAGRATVSPTASERFLHEARAMAAIKHDNVATIYEVGEFRGTPYMAMELLLGRPLDAALKNGEAFSIAQITTLGRHIARGLSAAHARGIVHRDVKPANIWLESPSGRPKLLDFGLARSSSIADSLSQRGAVAGTPGYLSPEQARDDPVDDRTDVYGLGVVLHELLTGRLPYDEPTIVGLLIAILTKPAPVLTATAQLPESLAQLVTRMLAKEPSDRPESALVVERELKEIAEELQRGQSLPQISLNSTSTSSVRNTALKSSGAQRTRRLVAGGVALATLLTAGAFWWFANKKDAEVTQATQELGAPSQGTPKSGVESVAESISKEKLSHIQLQSVSLDKDTIPQGEFADFRIQWTNQATSVNDDPSVKFKAIRYVCQISATIQSLPEGSKQNAALLPLRFSARQLPPRGSVQTINSRFGTQFLEPGNYRVAVYLKTPEGEICATKETDFSVERNLLAMDLQPYEPIRTWNGRGADLALIKEEKSDQGLADVLTLGSDVNDQVVYLRFDVKRWGRPLKDATDAVLTLTLKKDNPQVTRYVQVWGVLEGVEPTQWPESGQERFKLENAPGLKQNSQARYLGQMAIDNLGGVLTDQRDRVRFASPDMTEWIQQDQDGLLTIFLVGKGGAPPPLLFYSKEADPENAPSLALITGS